MWILDLIMFVMAIFGFSYWIYVGNKFRKWMNRNKNYSIITKHVIFKNTQQVVNRYDK